MGRGEFLTSTHDDFSGNIPAGTPADVMAASPWHLPLREISEIRTLSGTIGRRLDSRAHFYKIFGKSDMRIAILKRPPGLAAEILWLTGCVSE